MTPFREGVLCTGQQTARHKSCLPKKKSKRQTNLPGALNPYEIGKKDNRFYRQLTFFFLFWQKIGAKFTNLVKLDRDKTDKQEQCNITASLCESISITNPELKNWLLPYWGSHH